MCCKRRTTPSPATYARRSCSGWPCCWFKQAPCVSSPSPATPPSYSRCWASSRAAQSPTLFGMFVDFLQHGDCHFFWLRSATCPACRGCGSGGGGLSGAPTQDSTPRRAAHAPAGAIEKGRAQRDRRIYSQQNSGAASGWLQPGGRVLLGPPSTRKTPPLASRRGGRFPPVAAQRRGLLGRSPCRSAGAWPCGARQHYCQQLHSV